MFETRFRFRMYVVMRAETCLVNIRELRAWSEVDVDADNFELDGIEQTRGVKVEGPTARAVERSISGVTVIG